MAAGALLAGLAEPVAAAMLPRADAVAAAKPLLVLAGIGLPFDACGIVLMNGLYAAGRGTYVACWALALQWLA